MRKIKRILILVTMLVLTHPQTLPTHASMSVHHQARNSRTPHTNPTSIPADAMNEDWIIECVECPKRFDPGSDRSLQVDSAGNPHIVYGGDNLYYTWYDGLNWLTEIVDNTLLVGMGAQLALDKAGNPHISYGGGQLRYAYQDSSGWQVHKFDSTSVGFNHTAIVVDGYGGVHITYYDWITNALMYTNFNGDHWITQLLDADVDLGEYSTLSMALDQQGYLHISYQGDNLKYAYQDADGWQFEIVGEFQGSRPSLALDNDGYPHISYISTADTSISRNGYSYLTYAWKDEAGWQNEAVPGSGYFPSLVVDQQGNAHLSYTLNGSLIYAIHEGAEWTVQTVTDYTYTTGWGTSLALAGDGKPHFQFFATKIGAAHSNLVYAKLVDNGWQTQTLDVEGWVGSDNSIALDDQDQPHISYIDNISIDLKYSHRDEAGWHTEVVDNVGWTEKSTSLAIDANGHPHIAYGSKQGLKYAFKDASGWNIHIVDPYICEGASLVLDQDGKPHISYLSDGLRYAYLDDTGWVLQLVEYSTSSIHYFTSLALDKYGYAHISYVMWSYEDKNYDLWHAYQVNNGWQIDLVDTFETEGGSDLALDEQGYPHIAYGYSGDIEVLKHAYKDEAGWHMEIVDSSQYTWYPPGIGIDRNGRVHISYVNTSGLAYAVYDGNRWYFDLVDQQYPYPEYIVDYISMTLDNEGLPHISYRLFNDLKYAKLTSSIFSALVRPDESWGYGLPGATIIHTLQVMNSTQFTDTFDLSGSTFTWPTSMPANVGPVPPSDTARIDIQVTIPSTVTLGSSDTATLTLTSQSDSSISASAILTTYAALTTYLPLVSR